jgi:NAD-dependent deacetylase
MDSLDKLTIQIAEIIRKAKKTVLFSGAGISTRSGIPDFRSPSSGLWNKYNPMEVASLTAFKKNPDKFYDWLHLLVNKSKNAIPNPAHHIIAEMQNFDLLQTIMTQNIDGLHQKAGATDVLELHGNLNKMCCQSCRIEYENSLSIHCFIEFGKIPVGPGCGDILKPNIILYEELLPQKFGIKQ